MFDQLEADFPEYTPRQSHAPRALEGVRVVDFSHFIAGPFATMILADMGAEIEALEAQRDKTQALKRAVMQQLLTGLTRLSPFGGAHV